MSEAMNGIQPTPNHVWDIATMSWKLPSDLSELSYTTCSTTTVELPVELFSGYEVYEQLTENQKKYTSHENVSAVLDAVVRLMRINQSS